MILIYLMLIMIAYAQGDSNSTKCVPFPHSHLLCGRYINASTMVYIDPNVFNYTEANNGIAELDDNERIFSNPRVIETSLPPCMDDCLGYTEKCRRGILGFTTATRLDDELGKINFNCSAPFSTFSSVGTSVDTENCYNFSFSPIFLRSTIESSNDTRLIVLDQNSSTEYCSELQRRNISVACRAVGIPKPQVDIFVNGNIVEPFYQTENEVVIRLAPISYGEVVMFECQASTMTTTSNITVNLSYTCCMDDRRIQHSIGEHFVTMDCRQCFCGTDGSISCDQSQCESGISPGIIVVIILSVILVISTIAIIVILIWWSVKRRYVKKEDAISEPQKSIKNSGDACDTNSQNNDVMSRQNLNGHQNISSVHSTDLASTKQRTNSSAEAQFTVAAPPAVNLTELLTSLEPEEFKPTEDVVITAFDDHLLEDFIVSHDHLNILETLGEGAFGKVFHGFLTNESDQTVEEVAIKTIKECNSMDELNLFISESVIMKNFEHRNVLGLIGVSVGVHDDIAIPYIILPYMANGDLKEYLQYKRSEAENNPESLFKIITYSMLVKICCDICHGMEYLASIRFVHRDLAARNCMVGKDLVVKVADFGLSRDIYSDEYYRLRRKASVPIKWMPPESLHDGYFNQMTDVWAFGVCCWEIFSLGKAPYAGVEFKNILQYIESGKRLPKTPLCRDEMYQIMLSCWQLENTDRPTFSTLAEQLEQHYSGATKHNISNPFLPHHNTSTTESTYINWKSE